MPFKPVPTPPFSNEWFKEFVESYRCRICKTPLNLDNFGGVYENHGIACKDCYLKILPSNF